MLIAWPPGPPPWSVLEIISDAGRRGGRGGRARPGLLVDFGLHGGDSVLVEVGCCLRLEEVVWRKRWEVPRGGQDLEVRRGRKRTCCSAVERREVHWTGALRAMAGMYRFMVKLLNVRTHALFAASVPLRFALLIVGLDNWSITAGRSPRRRIFVSRISHVSSGSTRYISRANYLLFKSCTTASQQSNRTVLDLGRRAALQNKIRVRSRNIHILFSRYSTILSERTPRCYRRAFI